MRELGACRLAKLMQEVLRTRACVALYGAEQVRAHCTALAHLVEGAARTEETLLNVLAGTAVQGCSIAVASGGGHGPAAPHKRKRDEDMK
jgi:hypothetical protein